MAKKGPVIKVAKTVNLRGNEMVVSCTGTERVCISHEID